MWLLGAGKGRWRADVVVLGSLCLQDRSLALFSQLATGTKVWKEGRDSSIQNKVLVS